MFPYCNMVKFETETYHNNRKCIINDETPYAKMMNVQIFYFSVIK